MLSGPYVSAVRLQPIPCGICWFTPPGRKPRAAVPYTLRFLFGSYDSVNFGLNPLEDALKEFSVGVAFPLAVASPLDSSSTSVWKLYQRSPVVSLNPSANAYDASPNSADCLMWYGLWA